MSESFFKEFTVGDSVYHCYKMNAKQQFHVMRRILPILTGAAKAGDGLDQEAAIVEKIKGAALALAEISDEDADYVIDRCLAVVKRQQGGGWQAVWSPGGGLMFKDIDMMQMMQMVGEVLAYNLGNFTEGLPSGIQDIVQKSPASSPSA